MKRFFMNAVNNSRIFSYFRGSDYYQLNWINSIFFFVLDRVLNGPFLLLKRLFTRWTSILESSVLIRLFKIISEKLHILIGLVLIFMMVIPDHKWYNKYGVMLVLLLLAVFLLKLVIVPKTRFEIGYIDYSAILFFFTIFLAGITSLFPKESLNSIVFYGITFVAMILVVSSIDTLDDLNVLIKLVAFGIFLTAVYGIYQWKVVGIAVNPAQTDLIISQDLGGRLFSTMGNPNIYGELLVLSIPFFGAIILNEKALIKKAFWIILLLPIILVLFKTGSRSAWGALAIAMFVFVFLWNKKFIPIFILLGIIALPFVPSSIYKRALSVFNPNDTSKLYRQKIMKSALSMLKDYWVTGAGLGTNVAGTIFQRYKSFGLTRVAHTHNLYIQIWLEAGIFAILTFFMLIFRMFRNTVIAVREKKNPAAIHILIASLSAALGLMVMGFADHVWFYNRILFMFWIDISIGLSALKLLKRT